MSGHDLPNAIFSLASPELGGDFEFSGDVNLEAEG